MMIGATTSAGITGTRRTARQPKVAIIGAGLGGIAVAVMLQRKGLHDVTVFEASDGPGGTWRDNSYPGAGCDIPTVLYSYSFNFKTDWSTVYASQPEILEYIEGTVDRFNLREKCRFETPVDRIQWDGRSDQWKVRTADGEECSFDVVVSSVGLLNVPNVPDIPGLEEFRGEQFHTAKWDHEVPLTGKRVAVVGTGSSAAQVVPSIADAAGEVFVFQREPGWQVEKGDRRYREDEIERFRRHSIRRRLTRFRTYWRLESGVTQLTPGSRVNRERKQLALDWLERTIKDEDLRRTLTPNYAYGCKRVVRDDRFYPSLNRSDINLVPSAVSKVLPGAVVTEQGNQHEVDVIVWATGFKASEYLHTFEVIGPNGQRLEEHWEAKGGAEAFLGLAVSGFPNFFLTYGPNSNSYTMSIVFILEAQARYIARAIRTLQKKKRPMSVWSPLQDLLNRKLQMKMDDSTWMTGCNTYFRAASGKVVTQWPFSTSRYWLMTKLLTPRSPWVFREFVDSRR